MLSPFQLQHPHKNLEDSVQSLRLGPFQKRILPSGRPGFIPDDSWDPSAHFILLYHKTTNPLNHVSAFESLKKGNNIICVITLLHPPNPSFLVFLRCLNHASIMRPYGEEYLFVSITIIMLLKKANHPLQQISDVTISFS